VGEAVIARLPMRTVAPADVKLIVGAGLRQSARSTDTNKPFVVAVFWANLFQKWGEAATVCTLGDI